MNFCYTGMLLAIVALYHCRHRKQRDCLGKYNMHLVKGISYDWAVCIDPIVGCAQHALATDASFASMGSLVRGQLSSPHASTDFWYKAVVCFLRASKQNSDPVKQCANCGMIKIEIQCCKISIGKGKFNVYKSSGIRKRNRRRGTTENNYEKEIIQFGWSCRSNLIRVLAQKHKSTKDTVGYALVAKWNSQESFKAWMSASHKGGHAHKGGNDKSKISKTASQYCLVDASNL